MYQSQLTEFSLQPPILYLNTPFLILKDNFCLEHGLKLKWSAL